MSNTQPIKNLKELEVIIAGKIGQPEITCLKHILSKINNPKNQLKHEFTLLFETQYNSLFDSLAKENLDFLFYKGQSPIIYHRDKKTIIGNFEEFKKFIILNYSYIELTPLKEFKSQALAEYKDHLKRESFKYAYFDFGINSIEYSGKLDRVVFELFHEICPKTVTNFLQLCQGGTRNSQGKHLSYKDSAIFRIVPNGYIQGGDLKIPGNSSIYNGQFEDESYEVKHDTAGLIGMVKSANKPHSNESQFYITLNPLRYFDNKFVVFGRVISGFSTIEKISSTETYLQRPKYNIEVKKCGEFNADMYDD